MLLLTSDSTKHIQYAMPVTVAVAVFGFDSSSRGQQKYHSSLLATPFYIFKN